MSAESHSEPTFLDHGGVEEDFPALLKPILIDSSSHYIGTVTSFRLEVLGFQRQQNLWQQNQLWGKPYPHHLRATPTIALEMTKDEGRRSATGPQYCS